jgi:hypothetical protein
MALIEQVVTGSVDAVLSSDERSIAFTLMTDIGPLGRVRFALDDVPVFIAHLCQVVASALPEPRPGANSVPIPVLGVGFFGSDRPETSRFVLSLQGMTLQYSFTAEATGTLADTLEQMAQTVRMLGASGTLQ